MKWELDASMGISDTANGVHPASADRKQAQTPNPRPETMISPAHEMANKFASRAVSDGTGASSTRLPRRLEFSQTGDEYPSIRGVTINPDISVAPQSKPNMEGATNGTCHLWRSPCVGRTFRRI
jgi:hypothetical protein